MARFLKHLSGINLQSPSIHAQIFMHMRMFTYTSYALNDYTPHEQELANRRWNHKRESNQHKISRIPGDPAFDHVRRRIDKVKFITELEYILENPDNYSTCVFNRAIQKATKMNKYHYSKKIFDDLLASDTKIEYIDAVSFTSLFHAFAKMRTHPKIIYQYIEKMKQLEIHPTEMTLSAVIQALRKRESYDNVMKIWRQFTQNYNITPGVICHTELLMVYAKAGKVEEAENLWIEMVKHQDALNSAFTVGAMLNVYAENCRTDKIIHFLNVVVESDTVPIDSIIVNTLMKCYLRAKQPFNALYVYDMIETTFGPKYGTKSDEIVLLSKASAYQHIIRNNLGDQYEYLQKLREEIPNDREKIGLNRTHPELSFQILEALANIHQNPKEWHVKIVPEFELVIQKYNLAGYLNKKDNDGSTVVDLRKFPTDCAVFVVWYVFNYCHEIVSAAKGNTIGFITGKNDKNNHLRQLVPQGVKTKFPGVQLQFSSDGSKLLIAKKHQQSFRTPDL